MRVFFDTSAYIKKFVSETDSIQIDSLLENTSELGLSVICFPEIISALNRKRREQILGNEDYKLLKTTILASIEDADIINITPLTIGNITQLLETNSLSSLDAIHIAAAIEWRTELFVSADKRQVMTARNAGLQIERIA